MTERQPSDSESRIQVELSVAEWGLVDNPLFLPTDFTRAFVRTGDGDAYVAMLTIDELEDLLGYTAATRYSWPK